MNPDRTTAGAASGEQRYRFGDVVVDPSAHTLVRAGQPQTVEPKAFAVLLVLLRRANELVGRDELLDQVWGHRHVTPGVLTRAIAQLRNALGDDFHHPVYIQTQHALGYRFIGSLQRQAAAVAEPPSGDRDAVPPGCCDAPDGGVAGSGVASAIDAPGLEVAPSDAAGRAQLAAADAIARPGPAPAPTAAAAPAAAPAPAPAPAPAAPRTGDRRRRRWGWSGAAAVGLAAAAATLLWLSGGLQPIRPADASIAVLPFSSLSNARDDRYFAEGLAVEMHDALAGVPGLDVAALRPAAQAGGDQRDVKALGRQLGVATVLDASVRRDGARMRISARLADTRTGFTLWSGSFDRDTSDVFAVQSEIAHEVVQALLGMLPGGGQSLAKRLAPTRNIVAYDAYLKGVQQLQDPGNDQGLDAAIRFFGEALAADPAFGRAQAGICRAEIARFEGVRDATAFDRAQAACMRATAMDPGLREVSLALGEMYRARGDSAKAIEQYTRTLDDIALQPAALVGMARTEGARGRNALALDYFQRALKLRPRDATIHRHLGYHHYLAGDLPAAIEAFRTATALQPGDEGLWSSLGGLYLAGGDVEAAAGAFERSLAIKPNYAALSNLGSLKYEAGAYAEAADLYRRAAQLDPQDFRVWGNLGDALSALPATAGQAGSAYRRAAQMADRYIGIKSDDAQAMAQLAWYRANLGEGKAAGELLARAEAMATEQGEVAFWGAQTLALLGDIPGARQRVARARAADIPAQRIQAAPVLRRLDERVQVTSSTVLRIG